MFITDENAETLAWGAIAFTAVASSFYVLRRLKRLVACEIRQAMSVGRTG